MLDGNGTEPHVAVLPEQSEGYSDPSTRITGPQPIANAQVPSANTPERVIDRLSKAAQRIAEEQSESILHKRPRASRLAPIRDISTDIRRESTPSIRTWEVKNVGTQWSGASGAHFNTSSDEQETLTPAQVAALVGGLLMNEEIEKEKLRRRPTGDEDMERSRWRDPGWKEAMRRM